MSSEFTVRNDISCLGLRRLHVLRAGKPVDLDVCMKRVAEEEGELAAMPLTWYDDALDIHHLYLVWRHAMITEAMYVITCNEMDIVHAAARAAEAYAARFGLYPNRAAVRTGTPDLPGAPVKVVEPDGKIKGELQFVTINGLRRGDVGVFVAVEQ